MNRLADWLRARVYIPWPFAVLTFVIGFGCGVLYYRASLGNAMAAANRSRETLVTVARLYAEQTPKMPDSLRIRLVAAIDTLEKPVE